MVDVLIPREPIPVALTAEQVVAYLLRPGSGWVEVPTLNTARAFRWEADDPMIVVVGRNANALPIEGIAFAEDRPALDVAQDIAGPAVGVGGVGCAVGMDGPWLWGGCRRTERCNREAPRAPEVK